MSRRVCAMLVHGDLTYDNRVQRQAESVARLGYEVHLFSVPRRPLPELAGIVHHPVTLGDPPGAGIVPRLPSRLRRQGKRLYKRARADRRLAAIERHVQFRAAVWPELARLRPNVIHAHDLKTLFGATSAARKLRVPLIYDAHELELYSIQIVSRLDRAVAWLFEGYGVRTAAAVTTSAAGYADGIARAYRVSRPRLILNTPPLVTARTAPEASLRDLCGLVEGDRLLTYVGLVGSMRDTPLLLEALARLPAEFHLAAVGPRVESRDAALRAQAEELSVERQVHLLPPVPGIQLPALLSTSDVAVIAVRGVCRSYDLTMANKLFESLMAGIPIAVSPRPAMAAFVREHELGIVLDESSPAAMAEGLAAAALRVPAGIADRGRLERLRERYCWEAQEGVLAEIYRSLPSTP